MTRAQYEAWQRDGEPFRLMTPADDLRDWLRAHGYTVYGIGNESHMLANPAEDHTPFSQTGWPGTAKYGVGYAVDIMPPAKGAKSKIDGLPLPSLQQLGAQMVADRKAGVPGIRWLKYMNWEPERDNGGPCYQESWKPNHARKSSTDRGHIHMSGLTGFEASTTAAGYDPVARIRGGDDMSEKASQIVEAWSVGLQATKSGATVEPVKWRIRDEAWQKKTDATLAAVLAATKGLDTKAILARIDQVAAAESDRDAQLADLVRRAGTGELTAEQVVNELARRLTAEQQE